MNLVWPALILVAFAVGLGAVAHGGIEAAALGQSAIDASKASVDLAIGLVGIMALFLGVMRIAERAGLMAMIARGIRPLLVRLFPEVPADHPAMGAIILNISANLLGLANAATPFGIRAMEELDTLNKHKGTATNAMCLFLAINTSSVTLLPTGVIAVRASLGSTNSAAIFLTTLLATCCSTVVAILAIRFFERTPFFPLPEDDEDSSELEGSPPLQASPRETLVEGSFVFGRRLGMARGLGILTLLLPPLLVGTVLVMYPTGASWSQAVSDWIIPLLIVELVVFGLVRGVPVYDAFIEGAREAFGIALKIIPYLVGILFAIGMLRASGAIDLLARGLEPITSLIGLPAEALPMALLRPLSGSGAYGVMFEIMKTHGPDSYIGYLVSTFQGSTETTFYVLAVYFGAVRITRTRHALPAALCADVAGILAAVFACRWLLSP